MLHYQQRDVNGSNETIVINNENTISYELTQLHPWTQYAVQLAAFNGVGRSNFTNVTVARTHESGTRVSLRIVVMKD